MRPHRAVVISRICLASLCPAALPAQSVADRAALSALDSDLQQVSTPTALDPLHSTVPRDGEARALARTLLRLRRGEVEQNRGELEQVVHEAAYSARGHAEWPWAWYLLARGLAALELRGWESLRPSESVPQGESYSQATWRHLGQALELDHDFPAARQWLFTLLVAGGDRLLTPEQFTPLEREVQRADPDQNALLVWGRHLRTVRLYDSALRVFTRTSAEGGDRSVLALERARTLRALHNTPGAAAAYWEGLHELTPAGRALYRFDLAWILDADSLAAFDGTPDSGVVRWLRTFWAQRDANAVGDPGSRLDEHLRRWALVHARYRVRSPWRRTMYSRVDMFFDNARCMFIDLPFYQQIWELRPSHEGDLRQKEWLLDQRALIYLRHGDPIQRIGGRRTQFGPEDFESGAPAYTPDTTAVWVSEYAARAAGSPGVNSIVPMQTLPRLTESWLYLIEGSYRLLHFRDSYGLGMYDATTLVGFLPYSPSTWLALSGTLPEYHAAGARLASELGRGLGRIESPSCWNEVRRANARSRADAETAVAHDTDAPPLVGPWRSVVQMFALGDDRDRSGKVLITFALGGDALLARTMDDGRTMYEIHFRVAAWNPATGQSVSLNRTRNFVRDQPLAEMERLVSWLEVPLTGGRWEVGVRAKQESDSSGVYVLRRDVEVGSRGTLGLSDLVTGLPGAPPWQATDGADFPVNSTRAWPAATAAELFFEVHGVPANDTFRTTVAVRRQDGKSERLIELSSTDRSSGPVHYMRRALGLDQLEAGTYELSVTVSAAGRQVVRSVTIILLPPSPAGP